MKQINIKLNNEEYNKLNKICKRMKISKYKLSKTLYIQFLELNKSESISKVERSTKDSNMVPNINEKSFVKREDFLNETRDLELQKLNQQKLNNKNKDNIKRKDNNEIEKIYTESELLLLIREKRKLSNKGTHFKIFIEENFKELSEKNKENMKKVLKKFYSMLFKFD